jgi:hypothetical protein
MNNMKIEELTQEVVTASQTRPDYIRFGQFVFNYIEEHYGVARQVQFIDGVDCFYRDDKVLEFLDKSLIRINEA